MALTVFSSCGTQTKRKQDSVPMKISGGDVRYMPVLSTLNAVPHWSQAIGFRGGRKSEAEEDSTKKTVASFN